MPFWRTYYHLVWATKNRAAIIDANVEKHLYPYLHNKCKELGMQLYAADGWFDHTHIVTSIPPKLAKLAVASAVKNLKGASSHYLNHTVRLPDHFVWQRGYGVFTLGESQLARAIAYVQRQKEHHRQQTTNAWLERVDEFDDGPPDNAPGIGKPGDLREPGPVYSSTFP